MNSKHYTVKHEKDSNNICSICRNDFYFYSVGICNHFICAECSIRMRVLCDKSECPICRQDLPKVIYSNREVLYENVVNEPWKMDLKYSIVFETSEIENFYRDLTMHSCSRCPQVFSSFSQLDKHTRRTHELFYCDLCSNHLKIFTHERRVYTRKQLGFHRRKGDPDDTSHKGHPLCEFCQERFVDNEALFVHLRKDHFFCHFCDGDGVHNDYYPDYGSLKTHFEKAHFVCSQGDCLHAQFTSTFKDEIDYKAHRAEIHGLSFSKVGAKINRMVEVELSYGRHGVKTRDNHPHSNDNHHNSLSSHSFSPSISFSGPMQSLPELSDLNNFPSLSSSLQPQTLPSRTWNKNPGMSGSSALRAVEESFPSLSSQSSSSALLKTFKSKSISKYSSPWNSFQETKLESNKNKEEEKKKKKIITSKGNNDSFPYTPSDFPNLEFKKIKSGTTNKQSLTNTTTNPNHNNPNNNNYSKITSSKNTISQNVRPSLISAPHVRDSRDSSTRVNFKTKTHSDFTKDDYPPLVSSKTKILSASAVKSPPPGFKSDDVKKVPPGFSSTSVSPSFYQPLDFEERNKALVFLINELLGKKSVEFEEFKNISSLFRRNGISTEKYYDKCVELTSKKSFLSFFPNLLTLLPDISKQKELLAVHRVKNKSWVLSSIVSCDKCEQILMMDDVPYHNSNHDLDSSFPHLSISSTS